jgi:hypothetical protein
MIRVRFAFEGLPASYIIRFASYGFPASHCEVVTPDGLYYLGSRFPDGVQKRARNVYPWSRFVDLPTTQDQQEQFFVWAESTIGDGYDMPDLLANFTLERDWRSGGKWWCSEWLAFGLEKVKWFEMPLTPDVNHITPRDLAIAFSAKGVPLMPKV